MGRIKRTEMKTALLIIDLQNDYFPGGKNELVGSLNASIKGKRTFSQF
jgi:nicotinamidase-related amidase